MNVLISLLTGFATAFIGITPGLLNMTGKVNLKEGKRNAIWFVLGAIIIIFFKLL
jgi:threonine/homoserine/homoserine lactone efflux protein